MSLGIGSVSVTRVAELESWVFPTSEMFPTLVDDVIAGPTVDFSIATYVVRSAGTTVLVDAGNGNHKHRPVLTAHDGFETDYLARLAKVVAPEEIDVVVCTHLHPDHCGGQTTLVDGEWRPTFPRARYLVDRADLAWLESLHAAGPTEGPAADLARTFADSVLPLLDVGLVDVVDFPRDLAPGVRAVPAPGHTPGHLVVEIEDDEELAVICGDVFHQPFQIADPAISHAGDADPALAARTRAALADRLTERDGVLLPAHFAPGRVLRTDGGLVHQPVWRGVTRTPLGP